LDALVTEDIWESGMGEVILSRQLPSGEVAFAFLLIDRYCLGVKSVFGSIRTRAEYREIIESMQKRVALVNLPPANLRCLVEDAVEYARDLGLEPHPDYRRVRPIFGDIDPAQATERFEFGSEGKPLFIAGPDDDLPRCYQILSILEERCGKDGYHYMLPTSDGESGPFGSTMKSRVHQLGDRMEDDSDDDPDDE
jgi:hypothetical protein